MDENHQDKTESETPATEAKVSAPSEKKVGMPKDSGTRKRVNLGARLFKAWATPIGIGTIIAVGTLLWGVISFTLQQQSALKQAEEQHLADQQTALDQQRAATLQTYIDSMKDLLLNRGLLTSKPGDPVRAIARIETLSTMRQLDGKRNSFLVKFLQDALLIGINFDTQQYHNIVSFGDADLISDDLSGADFSEADFGGADLSRANLDGAYLGETKLRGAYLIGAYLDGAYLGDADLRGADLSYVDLSGAMITDEQLAEAKSLQGATMPDGSIHP